jgi:hypothetical protein
MEGAAPESVSSDTEANESLAIRFTHCPNEAKRLAAVGAGE